MLAAAILFSMAMIALLWRGDPKRRRIIGQRTGDGATRRRLLFGATLLPGILLAATGDSAAFLIWLGSCVIAGWLAAQVHGRSTR